MAQSAESGKNLRICLLIPVSDSIPGMFLPVFSGIEAEIVKRGGNYLFLTTDMVPLDKAREFLLRTAVTVVPEPNYILWLDADMFVKQGQVSALLDYMESNGDVAAVSALYFKKVSFDPVCFRHIIENGIEEYRSFYPPGVEPTEVDAAGLGCMLMRTDFIKRHLGGYIERNSKLFWFDEYPEDINFCSLVQKEGGRIVVLPNVVVPHHGGYVSESHYKKLKVNQ